MASSAIGVTPIASTDSTSEALLRNSSFVIFPVFPATNGLDRGWLRDHNLPLIVRRLIAKIANL
jgi:hypothetical protein